MIEAAINKTNVEFKEGEDMNAFQLVALPTETSDPKITLEQYDQLRITKEKSIANPEPTITIGGGAVASAGNITGISAAAKAGKTAVVGVILAGAISRDGNIDGFEDIKVLPNIEGKAVIHFDTEQSDSDQQYFINGTLKRAGVEKTPDYYRSYNIRQLNLENYREITDNICELSSQRFNGIHLIVIDGGADYLTSVNDESQATIIVHYFTQLSIRYACPVIIIVHLNPGTEKERGHFGSEVQRKCYGLLTIKKDGDISTLEPKIMRKAGNGEIPLIHFTYSKEKGYHVQIEAVDKEKARAEKTMDKTRAVALTVFAPPTSLKHTEAINKISQDQACSSSTAKRMISNMESWGFITKGGDGYYRLSNNKNV